MRIRWAAIVLLSGACTPGPEPTKQWGPHPYFPIAAGDYHALGKTVPELLDGGVIQCSGCHAPADTNFVQFECTGACHAPDVTAAVHGGQRGPFYDSKACYVCHPDGRPPSPPSDPLQALQVDAGVPTFEGNVIVKVTDTIESLPMTMNHVSAQVPPVSACSDCHPSAAIGIYYPGQFHLSLDALNLPQPTACSDCHAGSSPAGFVGSIKDGRNPPSGEMRHDVAAGVGDCGTCHSAPSQTSGAHWSTTALFHAAQQPATCLECHANTRPEVVSWPDAGVRPGLVFDHSGAAWLGECSVCHVATSFTSWSGGQFHASAGTPATCLPCHAGERPASGSGLGYLFDFLPNDAGVSHGGGQDCHLCHAGSTGQWPGASFLHTDPPATVTCILCHTTQWSKDAGGFDHADNGTGDCFGCHQSGVSPDGGVTWDAGQSYPGDVLISSVDQFISVDAQTLKRNAAGLITGTTKTTLTLYNAMKHTSSQVPAAIAPSVVGGVMTNCWVCHTHDVSLTVTAFRGGQFHPALTDAGLPQPSAGCTDCHSNMRPRGIVGTSDLSPMDHILDGGVNATSDCSVCHLNAAGVSWDAGQFHDWGQAVSDCASCHFPLVLAGGPAVDVISTASQKPYAMKHRSPQVTVQQCTACHASVTVHTPDTTSWNPGVFHGSLSPAACADCHDPVSAPADIRTSAVAYNGDPQRMNHQAALVRANDCIVCHGADSAGVGWSMSTVLHAHVRPTSCAVCHAANMPSALVDSTTVTSAPMATGKSGTHDQISHSDVNVTAHDCNFCHTQAGQITDGGTAAGKEWAQASFHVQFTAGTALVMDGTTGRCSNCHFNLTPSASFTAHDHSGLTASAGQDCSSCHQWPGTGTAASPNWQNVSGPPPFISVGGFSVAQPPATAATTEAGLNNLPHPAIPSGGSCTTCHASATGGRGAFGYDHSQAPATGCASCHEAGSDLVGTPWTLNAPGAVMVNATCGMGSGSIADRGGDTRPVGVASLPCTTGVNTTNHFYPSDCGECHAKPAAVPATVQTGATYAGNWAFKHYFGPPAQQATCCFCHASGSCRP
jgi:hypothetical protein